MSVGFQYLLLRRMVSFWFYPFVRETQEGLVMTQKPIDQVRQVLMNELGLTRESVREEMIVHRVIDEFNRSVK